MRMLPTLGDSFDHALTTLLGLPDALPWSRSDADAWALVPEMARRGYRFELHVLAGADQSVSARFVRGRVADLPYHGNWATHTDVKGAIALACWRALADDGLGRARCTVETAPAFGGMPPGWSVN